jgi:hypothetical protein
VIRREKEWKGEKKQKYKNERLLKNRKTPFFPYHYFS